MRLEQIYFIYFRSLTQTDPAYHTILCSHFFVNN